MKPHLQNLLDDWKRRRWEAFHRALGLPLVPPKRSKYRTPPGEGKCRLGWDSGVRKLRRAINRGLAGPNAATLKSAHDRRYAYINGLGRKRLRSAEKMALWHDAHVAAYAGDKLWQKEGRRQHERAAAELRATG